MAVQVTLSSPTPSSTPADGWIVGYKIKGAPGAYTVLPPFLAFPIVFTTTDPAGTLYEGYIKRDCGAIVSGDYFWTTPCQCSEDYNPVPAEDQCVQVDSVPPTVENSGYCLAASTNGAYSSEASRIYGPGFSDATIALPPGSSGGFIQQNLTTAYWNNFALSLSAGPMNREAVWIDSDCDGIKNPLINGTATTIAFSYNNPGLPRQVYVGVGGDNSWNLKLNGTQVGEATFVGAGAVPFKIWHIIPVYIITGMNYFNVVAIGDGTADDAVGMVIYDNSAAQLAAATTDASLNILFKTSTLRGTSYDVTTCPVGYSLDTTGGPGNYVCIKTLYKVCNTYDT